MLARWLTVIDTYDFEIQYRKGILHTNADAMSRVPWKTRKCKREDCPDCTTQSSCSGDEKGKTLPVRACSTHTDKHSTVHIRPCSVSENQERSDNTTGASSSSSSCLNSNWIDGWSHEQLVKLQQEDPTVGPILDLKCTSNEKPLRGQINQFNSQARSLWSQWETLVVQNGLLYRKPSYGNNRRLILPSELTYKIFEQLHKHRIAGHLGRDKTLASIKQRFYWVNLTKDVKRWCQLCDICSRRKPGPGRGRSPLKQDIAYQPLDRIALDILGPLPVSSDGNEYILVIGDYYTKFTEAYAIKDHTALTVADKLVTEFICRFGVPSIIHSDQGPEFESRLFKEMCRLLGIEKTRTVPYNSKSDGMIERHNRTIQQMLAMFVNENRNDWDDHLPFVMMAYRASCHESTKCSPNLLMYGREIQFPVDVMFEDTPDRVELICPSEYVEWLKQSAAQSFNVASQNLKTAASRQKKAYNKGLKPRKFEVGEQVWRWYPPTANLKLGLGWTGPYQILSKISEVTYRIQHIHSLKQLVVHVDHLKIRQADPEDLQESEADNESDIVLPEPSDSESDEEIDVAEPVTTPYRTRAGRKVKPKEIFSP